MSPSLIRTIQRLRRFASVDLDVLDEVRRDREALVPSLAVAAGAVLLFGLGGWLWWWRSDFPDAGQILWQSVLLGSLFALGLWLAWLLVVVAVLQRVARTVVPVEELVRTAGFAVAPLGLGFFMVVPGISFAVGLIAVGALVVAMQAAIEAATTADRGSAVVANLAGFAVWAGVLSLLATGDDPLAPGIFLADALWDALS